MHLGGIKRAHQRLAPVQIISVAAGPDRIEPRLSIEGRHVSIARGRFGNSLFEGRHLGRNRSSRKGRRRQGKRGCEGKKTGPFKQIRNHFLSFSCTNTSIWEVWAMQW